MKSTGAILLVGGTGFIGRSLAARLVKHGKEVHVLSRSLVGELPAGVVAHQGDQGDLDVVLPLLARCKEVFHLATATTPADTVWQPVMEAEASLLPALRFLEYAQQFPENRYVYVSTGGALYGDAEFAAEQIPLAPISYHGAGKLALESFFGVFGQRYPGRLSILRPSNVYGPGQGLRPGFGAVRTLLERARDDDAVVVYGDGAAVRDYLYIDDLVSACLCALSGPAGTYNIGAGRGTSLSSLLAVVERVTGRHLKIERQPARASDVKRIVLDIRCAGERLGWAPEVGLEGGVQRTWESLR
ncbi:NAD-dependent epimerase/dehydratase family protein [Ferribacterium limneticum]|uniref:NAD-dependent epimerase/dehydratase family protein n=1 Tax=Ferribacterium limneticum TaxID=76259 RepID=UPI001CF97102|nr:NAD-dependent epimerase/dehydratase family protein [Ferribacterium limneticum]UCV29289.1 NAD-dependent epimerase/dehydratase family protein [Ferribacterium limneticum]UCV33208.1 NAD-dependent epimerase/dehydratase family protein [Ferribacterium limneticum]